jgi:hypothetical protein
MRWLAWFGIAGEDGSRSNRAPILGILGRFVVSVSRSQNIQTPKITLLASWHGDCSVEIERMGQRLIDVIILVLFALLYNCAVLILRFRRQN